jgi:hypothetical protein
LCAPLQTLTQLLTSASAKLGEPERLHLLFETLPAAM